MSNSSRFTEGKNMHACNAPIFSVGIEIDQSIYSGLLRSLPVYVSNTSFEVHSDYPIRKIALLGDYD